MFGMGTGITSPLWPLAIINNFNTKTELVQLNEALRSRNGFEGSYYFQVSKNELNNMVKPHDLLVMLG